MIGPPGIPKFGRRTFCFAGAQTEDARERLQPLKWLAALYVAGVVAHFSHHLAMDVLIDGFQPTINEALTAAPISIVWPADLIHALIGLN